MRKKLKPYIEPIFKTTGWLEVILLSAMVSIVLLQVFSRIFFKQTPGWSEELAQLLTIWFGFLGSALLVREKGHIALEFFVKKLGEKVERIVEIAVWLIILGFSIYMIWGGVDLVRSTMQNHLPATHLPVGIAYLPIPVSGVLMFLALIFPKSADSKT